MILADRRIELLPNPSPAARPVLEAVMLGHCPGTARWERVARDPRLLEGLAGLGFGAQARRLEALGERPAPAPEAGDEDLKRLYGLPLRLLSLGHFQALFPEAFSAAAAYRSRLAGNRAWLPLAVQDFFESAGDLPDGAARLWVIRVDEAGGEAGFLPAAHPDLRDPASLGPFDRALLIPGTGLIALPDLERLQIPAQLADVRRVRLPNPEPVFLPCGTEVDDSHRERRHSGEMPAVAPRMAPRRVIPPILRSLARHRPDLQCLLALPLDPEARGELPAPSRQALALVRGIAGRNEGSEPHGELYPALRHLQLLYPYLAGPERPLASPAGLVAGAVVRSSQLRGPWRSTAGQPLPGHALPYPRLSQHAATALREDPGVGVLLLRAGSVELDDERLAGPAVPVAALSGGALPADYHSGEIARFLGWLRRELTALGERLLFDVDPRDPRPLMALERFLGELHARGALRGARPEQAYRVVQHPAAEAVLAFDIEIAPAFPIDRLRLTFIHDRDSGGLPRLEIRSG